MAGQEDTSSKAASKHTFETASPFYNRPASLSTFRAPQTIEGQVVGDAAKTAKPEAAKAAKPGGEPPKDPTPPRAPLPASEPQSRGFSWAGALVAAVIGAATGFASAYLTRHFLDDTQTAVASLDQRVSAFDSKLAADEKKIDAAASTRDALSALEKRVGAAEKSAKDALAAAQAPRPETAPSTASSNPDAPASVAPAPDLAPLQTRVASLEDRLMKLETTVNTPKTAERATQEPDAKPDPAQANAPAIAIIAENLIQKISSGAPFETELSALGKLGADKTKLAALQPSATKGVVTARALSDELTTLTPALLSGDKPASPAPAQDGFFARLMDHAKGLVHVRKAGDLSGDALSARIARAQNALAHDDVEHALQEWSGFPDTAKAASAQWAEAAKTRVSTLASAKTIVSDAMANLAKVKS